MLDDLLSVVKRKKSFFAERLDLIRCLDAEVKEHLEEEKMEAPETFIGIAIPQEYREDGD